MILRMPKFTLVVLLVSLLSVSTSSSQVLLIPEIPGNGVIMKQQLWSLIVNNLSGSGKQVILYISITDRLKSQVVLEASSGLLTMEPGVRRVAFPDWSPVSYASADIGFSDMRQLGQPMPVGEYLVCYRAYEYGAGTKEALVSECVKVIAEPLAPPQLIQPGNTSVLRDLRPVFTWTPPAPVNMFNDLSYDVIVSPKYERQSAEEALQRNLPVMTMRSVNNSLGYPSSFTNLEPGKTYAWQVVANDANRLGGKSEVWTFTILPDSVAAIIARAPFVRLKKQAGETTVLHQGILKLEYFNSLSDTLVHVEVYRDPAIGNVRRQSVAFDMRVKQGQNLLEYDLNGRIRFDEAAIYQVRLVNGRKEEWLMQFNPKYYL